MKGDRVRSLYFTDEFRDFYDSLSLKVRNKFDYVLTMIASEKIVSTKFVKHLVSYDLYEMRVSVGNNEIGLFFLPLIMIILYCQQK